MLYLSSREPERKPLSPALQPFLAAAKRRAGHLLIAKCQWLLNRRQLTPVEILNVTTREGELRDRHGHPDPEWIECRMLDFDEVDCGWELDPIDEADLPEQRG
jgi:hypothetical protein